MSGSSFKLITLALTFATAVAAGTIKDDDTLKKISNYREWSRVTQKPIALDYSSLGG